MRVYQFTVPASKASSKFKSYLVNMFGGYTLVEGAGSWADDTGKHVAELVQIFTVATTQGDQLQQYVCDYLRRVGEKAAYFSEIGTARIVTF